MKFCIASRCARCAVAVCLLLGFAAAGVHAKPIRLRNQTIHTERAEAAKMAAAQPPAKGALSGLYLVQFYTSPGPEQRAVLSAAGVHLLHYVPEDTFIARFRNEQQNQVRALPFVEWVGEYGPQFKVHEAVRAKAQGKAGAAGTATPIFDSTLSYQFLDQPIQLTNGQVFEYQLLLADPSEPLMITLAYTDVPGFPGSLPALVNDLDLEVIAPDGQMYRGNQFKNGESIPNPAVADTINNVEAVHLASPVPGVGIRSRYELGVIAHAVSIRVGGARGGHGGAAEKAEN